MAVEAEVQNCKKRKIVEKSELPFIHGNSYPFLSPFLVNRSKKPPPTCESNAADTHPEPEPEKYYLNYFRMWRDICLQHVGSAVQEQRGGV